MFATSLETGLKILDKIIPDKDAREKAQKEYELELLKTLQNFDELQTKINKTEAQHSDIFVAGWRPFIGWVCGFAFLWQYVLNPIITWWLNIYNPNLKLPEINTEHIFELTLAMLGFGGLRTYEKIKLQNFVKK